MYRGDHIAIVGCSDPLSNSSGQTIQILKQELEEMGLIVEISEGIFESNYADARTRADILMKFYQNPEIKAVFDVSGGDMANEILSYLDFDVIRKHPKVFFGYSDLTTVLNAIYQMTGQHAVLYQVRNIVALSDDSVNVQVASHQKKNFEKMICNESVDIIRKEELGKFSCHFIQGEKMEGIVVGGNIRCLLKLAGTPYFPDVQDKILFLEARSGGISRMTACISQLRQMGVFEKVRGILLGTFTALDQQCGKCEIEYLLLRQIDNKLPVARTREIGHALDSKALEIGSYYKFI